MNPIRRLSNAFKALHQLGLRQAGLFAFYRLGMRAGFIPRQTSAACRQAEAGGPWPLNARLFALPDPAALAAILGEEGRAALLAEADEIVAGRARLFGSQPVALELDPGASADWPAYEKGIIELPHRQPPEVDIKQVWEPARFGWAFTLGRAYRLNGDERYPQAFWHWAEQFWQANPPNRGPNWASAQEAALRLIAFAFAAQVFAASAHSSAERLARLTQSIAAHAARIPPTLLYARAQNNNHLLSEAAGLIAASRALPAHPQAKRWQQLGEKWFAAGLGAQIAASGAYCQHSTNYHRLMLQLVLLVNTLEADIPAAPVRQATRWLLALCDPHSGRAPNLGPNDGAYIFPFAACPFADYRPVLQAAARAFLGQSPFPPGPWDEMGLWFGARTPASDSVDADRPAEPGVLHSPSGQSWAYLRAVRFDSRPGHDDPLHCDLWWRGFNVAQDAGTFRYNAPPPWDNALASAFVHNTITLDGQEPMTRAGRFLYLDWAQGELLERAQHPGGEWEWLSARHRGYLRRGVLHTRTVVAALPERWLVEDTLQPAGAHPPARVTEIRLHWLLPDWPFTLDAPGNLLRLCSPLGWMALRLIARAGETPLALDWQLARAGEWLLGSGPAAPTLGWTSPTYGDKIPALSLSIRVAAPLPAKIASEFVFPP